MTISYSTGGSYATLGSESDRTALCELVRPSFRSLVQSDPLFRGDSPAIFARGNAECALEVVITKPYASKAAALESIRSLRGILKAPMVVKLAEGAEAQYYPGAACASYTPTLRGTAVEHHIVWQTQDVTGTDPVEGGEEGGGELPPEET